eukprot:847359-Rhodomonas_salina.2
MRCCHLRMRCGVGADHSAAVGALKADTHALLAAHDHRLRSRSAPSLRLHWQLGQIKAVEFSQRATLPGAAWNQYQRAGVGQYRTPRSRRVAGRMG